jgi:hypothetical protein
MKQMEETRKPVVVQVLVPPELPEAAMGVSEDGLIGYLGQCRNFSEKATWEV